MGFTWIVYKKDKTTCKRSVQVGFFDEMSARGYASMIRDISRMAGYSDRYIAEKIEEKSQEELFI